MRNCKFLRSVGRALLLGFIVFTASVKGQTNFTSIAGEYPVIGSVPGDQTSSQLAFAGDGGWVVWEDNATDGDGLGIGARRLDGSLSGEYNLFRINEQGVGDQEKPRVALLSNGGAVFVWQGGRAGFQKIFARFANSAGVFITGDVLVNTYTNRHQVQPVVATLSNGNVVIAWSSYGQDGDMLGVYGQILSNDGSKVGSEFRINQTTALNQKTPGVAGLADGNFVVVWTSEKQRVSDSHLRKYDVDVMARVFTSSAAPVTGEIVLQGGNVCAEPSVVALQAGFSVIWSQKDVTVSDNGWDIFFRSFDNGALPSGALTRVNSTTFGDQFAGRLSISQTNLFVVWTSLGQDGYQEGVYGKALAASGSALSEEILVNTTTRGKQLHPSVAADETGRFLVVWSSYVGGAAAFDLFAQRFAVGSAVDQLPSTIPFVSAQSQTELSVRWPVLAGYQVAFYEVYVDGSSTPFVVNGNHLVVGSLSAGTTYGVRLLYQLSDGRRSPLSSVVTGKTWGLDSNGDGLPDDWQALIWGNDPNVWPSPDEDSDGDGASNWQEFLAGTNPLNSSSVLKTRLFRTQNGFVFTWNTEPGLVYQVQSADTLNDWQSVGSPRFAHSTVDVLNFGAATPSKFYRVIRLR